MDSDTEDDAPLCSYSKFRCDFCPLKFLTAKELYIHNQTHLTLPIEKLPFPEPKTEIMSDEETEANSDAVMTRKEPRIELNSFKVEDDIASIGRIVPVIQNLPWSQTVPVPQNVPLVQNKPVPQNVTLVKQNSSPPQKKLIEVNGLTFEEWVDPEPLPFIKHEEVILPTDIIKPENTDGNNLNDILDNIESVSKDLNPGLQSGFMEKIIAPCTVALNPLLASQLSTNFMVNKRPSMDPKNTTTRPVFSFHKNPHSSRLEENHQRQQVSNTDLLNNLLAPCAVAIEPMFSDSPMPMTTNFEHTTSQTSESPNPVNHLAKLQSSVNAITLNAIINQCVHKSIKGNFNPASAPNFGGSSSKEAVTKIDKTSNNDLLVPMGEESSTAKPNVEQQRKQKHFGPKNNKKKSVKAIIEEFSDPNVLKGFMKYHLKVNKKSTEMEERTIPGTGLKDTVHKHIVNRREIGTKMEERLFPDIGLNDTIYERIVNRRRRNKNKIKNVEQSLSPLSDGSGYSGSTNASGSSNVHKNATETFQNDYHVASSWDLPNTSNGEAGTAKITKDNSQKSFSMLLTNLLNQKSKPLEINPNKYKRKPIRVQDRINFDDELDDLEESLKKVKEKTMTQSPKEKEKVTDEAKKLNTVNVSKSMIGENLNEIKTVCMLNEGVPVIISKEKNVMPHRYDSLIKRNMLHCKYCNRFATSWYELITHKLIHARVSIPSLATCRSCGKMYSQEPGLEFCLQCYPSHPISDVVKSETEDAPVMSERDDKIANVLIDTSEDETEIVFREGLKKQFIRRREESFPTKMLQLCEKCHLFGVLPSKCGIGGYTYGYKCVGDVKYSKKIYMCDRCGCGFPSIRFVSRYLKKKNYKRKSQTELLDNVARLKRIEARLARLKS